jgi:fatty acid desaturase
MQDAQSDWSPTLWCVIIGVSFLVLAFTVLACALIARGKKREQTKQEVLDRMLVWDNSLSPSYAKGSGSGTGVEITMDLNGMRAAAKNGEWLWFWTFPVFFFFLAFGSMLLVAAMGLHAHDMVPVWLSSLIFVPFGFVGFFMAWAALYTDIDKHVRTDEQN